MGTLSSVKTTGGIGSILILLWGLPSIGFILGIAGFILVLWAIREISELVKDRKIFSDAIIAIGIAIITVIVSDIVVIGAFMALFGIHPIAGLSFGISATTSFAALAFILIPALAAAWVLSIVSAVFLRRSLNGISRRLDIGMFATAGLLYFIGALTVVLVIGFFIILVAEILLAVAFFSISEDTPLIEDATYA